MKKTFRVKGMHCNSCEMLIKDSLEDEAAIHAARASFKDGKVEVEFDEKVISESAIKSIIKKEGYEPQ